MWTAHYCYYNCYIKLVISVRLQTLTREHRTRVRAVLAVSLVCIFNNNRKNDFPSTEIKIILRSEFLVGNAHFLFGFFFFVDHYDRLLASSNFNRTVNSKVKFNFSYLPYYMDLIMDFSVYKLILLSNLYLYFTIQPTLKLYALLTNTDIIRTGMCKSLKTKEYSLLVSR